MAIIKRVKHSARGRRRSAAPEVTDVTQPSISYTNDGLADVIVSVWSNPGKILDRTGNKVPTAQAAAQATALINQHTGMNLKRAVIITENEHDTHYVMQDDDEVVFVLPNASRVAGNPTPHQLLETVRMLMACTPHGI